MEYTELLDALNLLEAERNISKEVLLEAISNALLIASKNHFGKADNIEVMIDPETCLFHVIAKKMAVEEVEDDLEQISLADAQSIDGSFSVGDIVGIEIESKEFGRIATASAKNVILQKIREEERRAVFEEFEAKKHTIVTGIVQRFIGRNISIDLGRADAILNENEQIRGEHYHPTDRIKVYILDVKDTLRGARIRVSRTHPDLIRCLFEEEVAEVREGIVEIRAIAREAGNRTKISVWSNDENVDPVGACVGVNGARVNAVTSELGSEKIDVTAWNENPAMFIEEALKPAKVISVIADADEQTAKVIVPDYQLSLAIGKEGQNARLAARLTGFKIDIKSETQARESGEFDFLNYDDDGYYDEDEYYDDEYYDGDAYADEPEGEAIGDTAIDAVADSPDETDTSDVGMAEGTIDAASPAKEALTDAVTDTSDARTDTADENPADSEEGTDEG